MDVRTMEGILHCLIQGIDLLSEALQLALMQCQNKLMDDPLMRD